MADFRTSIRVSEALKNKINKEKSEEESINSFLKNQVLREINISEPDFLNVNNLINTELNRYGKLINVIAREYNTNGIEKINPELGENIRLYLDTLKKINFSNIIEENISYIESGDFQAKDKIISINLNKKEKALLTIRSEKLKLKICEYVRLMLYNSAKYTFRDVETLINDLHHDVYRTINNLRQINYQLSVSDIYNLKPVMESIDNAIESIKRKENIIIGTLRGVKDGN